MGSFFPMHLSLQTPHYTLSVCTIYTHTHTYIMVEPLIYDISLSTNNETHKISKKTNKKKKKKKINMDYIWQSIMTVRAQSACIYIYGSRIYLLPSNVNVVYIFFFLSFFFFLFSFSFLTKYI